MNNLELLKKLIEKAEKNGCKRCLSSWLDYHDEEDIKYFKHFQIIFSHEFAKAYWGEEHIKARITSYTDNECDEIIHKVYKPGTGNMTFCADDFNRLKEQVWQYHLQQMVLEKEPLKYLEKFL